MTTDRNSQPRSAVLFLFFIGSLLYGAACLAETSESKVVAIVDAGRKVTKLELNSIRKIYSGRQRSWETGQRIRLILPESGTDAMDVMLNRVMPRMTEDDLTQFYEKLVAKEKIQAIPTQMSGTMAVAAIRKNPGYIALVDRASVADSDGIRMYPVQ